MDTEELICATSRSDRYYVSAAYWDRDTLLWAFPTILSADPALAKSILVYVFNRQRHRIGHHSRYIDGTLLEPGFELDELAAPVIALERYVDKTGDRALLSERYIQDTVREILEALENEYCEELSLYGTFLQPTDDEIVFPYLTYDNVLVWRMFLAISRLFPQKYEALAASAETLRDAILRHCRKFAADGSPFYAWSIDSDGQYDVYDEPPGSLQLLPYYGFCSMMSPVSV